MFLTFKNDLERARDTAGKEYRAPPNGGDLRLENYSENRQWAS